MNEMSKPKFEPSELSVVPTRGVDHLALVTDDMPATMEFYTRVMGMQLVHVRRVPFAPNRGQPPYEDLRHYFFNMGGDQLLAFFAYPKDVTWTDRDHLGGMQHLAFHVKRDELDALIAHVRSCGVEVKGPYSLGDRFWSAYLEDPNGIRLEFATSLAPEDVGIVGSARQTEEEARAELATLFDDEADIDRWLAEMPLIAEEYEIDIPPED